MQITHPDLEYLAEQTKLSLEKTFSLIEDEESLNLLLDAICEHAPTEAITSISFPLFCRLAVFNGRRASGAKLNLRNSAYVSDSIPRFMVVQNSVPLPSQLRGEVSEDMARFILVLLGLFIKVFNNPRHLMPSPNWYYGVALKSFQQQKPEIAEDLDKCVNILTVINKKYHFSTKILGNLEKNKIQLANK